MSCPAATGGCLAAVPSATAVLEQWWCGGDSAQAKPLCSRKKSASASIDAASRRSRGRGSDDLSPFATLHEAQNLRLCMQEAQTTGLWRIFGHTQGSRGLHPITQTARDAQCIGEEQGHAWLVFATYGLTSGHQQAGAERDRIAGGRATQE